MSSVLGTIWVIAWSADRGAHRTLILIYVLYHSTLCSYCTYVHKLYVHAAYMIAPLLFLRSEHFEFQEQRQIGVDTSQSCMHTV